MSMSTDYLGWDPDCWGWWDPDDEDEDDDEDNDEDSVG